MKIMEIETKDDILRELSNMDREDKIMEGVINEYVNNFVSNIINIDRKDLCSISTQQTKLKKPIKLRIREFINNFKQTLGM